MEVKNFCDSNQPDSGISEKLFYRSLSDEISWNYDCNNPLVSVALPNGFSFLFDGDYEWLRINGGGRYGRIRCYHCCLQVLFRIGKIQQQMSELQM